MAYCAEQVVAFVFVDEVAGGPEKARLRACLKPKACEATKTTDRRHSKGMPAVEVSQKERFSRSHDANVDGHATHSDA